MRKNAKKKKCLSPHAPPTKKKKKGKKERIRKDIRKKPQNLLIISPSK